MAMLHLPKNKNDLVDALDMEIKRADQEMLAESISWQVVDHYLRGRRLFYTRNRRMGLMDVGFENYKGELEFRFEILLHYFLVEVGRFMQMDFMPKVTRKRDSLQAMQQAAAAHAALTSRATNLNMNLLKSQAINPYLRYGTVGLGYYATGVEEYPDCIEVIQPRQLRGLPALTRGSEMVSSICRKRWVPLDWLRPRLEQVYGVKVPQSGRDFDELLPREVSWGATAPGEDPDTVDTGPGFGESGTITNVAESSMTTRERRERLRLEGSGDSRFYGNLEEVYVYADAPYLSRYIVKVGHKILVDENYEAMGRRELCPLYIARNGDTGRFYGRGYLDPRIPTADRIERAMGAVLKNVQDLDTFGTLMIPANAMVDLDQWKSGARPKYSTYEPDPVSDKIAPYAIQPVNSGTLPGQIAEQAREWLKELSGQGSMLEGEASGRMDTTSGHAMLWNAMNVAQAQMTHSLADAFSGVYGKMLEVVKRDFASSGEAAVGSKLLLTGLDDSMVGLKVDAKSGEIDVTSNPLPDPHEVTIDIKSRSPQDPANRIAQLKENVQLQLTTPERFWITVFQEGLDVPGAPKEKWEAWRKTIWNIVLLFGDGDTPGQGAKTSDHTTDPDIALMALQEFMNKLEFSLASDSVKQKFVMWKTMLELQAGRRLPENAPSVEQLAMQAQQQQQMMEQQAMGQPQPSSQQF